MQIIDRKIGEGILIDGFKYCIALGMDTHQIRMGFGDFEMDFSMESYGINPRERISFLSREQCRDLILLWELRNNIIH